MATYCDRHVAVGVGGHSVHDGGESSGGRSVSANCCGWVHVLEESERGRGDGQGANLLPLVDRIVKLLGSGESGEVPVKCIVSESRTVKQWGLLPGVAVVVDILGVTTDCDTGALLDARVDRVDGAE